MKKVVLMSLLGMFSLLKFGKTMAAEFDTQTLYDYSFKDIDGKERSMKEFQGKVVLVVNVASNCGFTKQYAGLEKLYEEFKSQGLVVLGFPSNNFGGQEPGSEKEIKFFCEENYKVSFPMFTKSDVKGSNINPIFKFLTSKAGSGVLWNFEKFLVGKDGKFIDRWRSITGPESGSIRKAVEKALASK